MCFWFQDVKWLQTITSMPILVKGVVTAEDSKLLDISVAFINELLKSLLSYNLCSMLKMQQELPYKLV